MTKESGLRKCFLVAALCLSPALIFADTNTGSRDQAVTIWGVFINNPSACASTPCSEADAFADGNPAETDVCYVTGARAPSRGRGTFGGRFAEGSHFGCIFSGLGLENAETTEIHFVGQRHGGPVKVFLTDQVTEFEGGCPPRDCLDVHFAIHVANGEFETVSDVFRFADGSKIQNASSTLRRFEDGIKVAINTKFRPARDTY